ncbi:MAG: hypothetical protein ACR2P2_02585 [Nakamurella sp.]
MDADLEARLAMTQAMLRAPKEPDALVTAGRHLAVRLHEISEDDALWKALRRTGHAAENLDAQQLAMLPMINWPPLLRALHYQEPPSAAFAAGEAVRLLQRAEGSADKADWDLLRSHLAWLGARLGREVGEPWASKDDSALSLLRYHVAQAWSVVREMDLVALFLDAAPTAQDAALAAFAPPPVNLQIILGKLALNLGVAVAKEVKATIERRGDASAAALADLRDHPALIMNLSGRLRSSLKMLDGFIEGSDWNPEFSTELPETVTDALDELYGWQSYVGAELAASWGYVALYSPDDVERLSRLGVALAVLAQAGRDIPRSLLAGEPDLARAALSNALTTQERVRKEVSELVISIGHNPGSQIDFSR